LVVQPLLYLLSAFHKTHLEPPGNYNFHRKAERRMLVVLFGLLIAGGTCAAFPSEAGRKREKIRGANHDTKREIEAPRK
jgi:hypothetical protein